MHRTEEIVILAVEDDSGHARLIEKNLRRSNLTNEIVKLTDGQQALDYLLGHGWPGRTSLLEPQQTPCAPKGCAP